MSGTQWEEFYDALRNARRQGSVLDHEPDADEARCVECGKVIGSSGRWYSDDADELVPYCAGCAERDSAL